MRELFVSLSLQAFGYTMISIFLPIFLLQRGAPLETVALYFLYWSAIQIPLHQVVVWLVHAIGVKHSLALSYGFSTVCFLLLGLLDNSNLVILAALTCLAIGQTFYWDSRHLQSTHIIPKKKTGRSVGLIVILVLVAAALGPMAGGFIAQQFGITATLVIASSLIVAAIIPLFMTKDAYFRLKKTKTKPKPVPMRHNVALGAHNYETSTAESLWPIFIFLIVGSLASLGVIMSLGFMLMVVITAIVGPLSDKGFAKSVLVSASWGRTLTHVLRIWVTTVPTAFAVNLVGSVFGSMRNTSFTTIFYQHARRLGAQRYIRTTQVWSSVGTAAVWASLYGSLQVFSPNVALSLVFIAAALISPLQNLIISRS